MMRRKNNLKKAAAFMMVLVMAFVLAGCGAARKLNDVETADEAIVTESGEGSDEAGSVTDIALESEAGGDYAGTDGVSEDDSVESGSMKDSAASKEMAEKIALNKGESENGETQKSAGTLTAGAWDDNENWGFYRNLFSAESDYNHYSVSWGMNFNNRIRVKVTDKGKPVEGAKAALYDKAGTVVWESISRYDGYADLFYSCTGNNETEMSYVEITKGSEKKKIELTAKKDKPSDDGQHKDAGTSTDNKYEYEGEYEAELSDSSSGNKQLDLMFMLDTTGSMGDEITFLQTELKDVVNTVKTNNSGLPIRVSMNFYRDEGDDYVVNSNEFSENVEEAQKLINAEYADGGGDYPEAVDQALYDGVFNHEWKEDSVKIMFLILDAPPHDGDSVNKNLIQSIEMASSRGIRIIPVAASGIDKDTEFLLRAMAIGTDGTYVFLTDDSGVGESHLQPTVGSYDVELLNELMVRLINQYLG